MQSHSTLVYGIRHSRLSLPNIFSTNYLFFHGSFFSHTNKHFVSGVHFYHLSLSYNHKYLVCLKIDSLLLISLFRGNTLTEKIAAISDKNNKQYFSNLSLKHKI